MIEYLEMKTPKKKKRRCLIQFQNCIKIKGHDYGKLYNETSHEDYDDYGDYKEEYTNLSDMPLLENDEEEIKEGKGLKSD